MADIRSVTPTFAVAPQLAPEDLAEAKAQGFTLVINNRPDGEAPGQPTGAQMQAAAQAQGLAYVAIPVIGGPNEAQVQAVAEAVASASGPVLAFCRSGTRSIVAWSRGRVAAGDDREAMLETAQAAGYDLSGAI